jgi:precorrin-2 dehydrogenase/sirohydrochlorin ferrochelatase
MLNVNLDLTSTKWLIVGGGSVGTRRAKKILQEDGSVKLVSPEISKGLAKLEMKYKELKIIKRNFRATDIKNQDFILACTNNIDLNKKIVTIAKSKKILVSNASDKNDNNFSFTSSIDLNKKVKINFSTGGSNPSFSKLLRTLFEKNLKNEILNLYKILDKEKSSLKPKTGDRLINEMEYTINSKLNTRKSTKGNL